MKIKRYIISLSVIFLLLVVSGCQPAPTPIDNPQPTITTGGGEVQNIRVEKASPQRTVSSSEEFPLPNCGGTEKLTQTLGTQVSVSKSVQMGSTVSLSGGGEVGVSAAAKITVQAAIEAEYKQEYETANSRLDTIGMGAAPKTHVIYTVEWERQEFSSLVTYELNRELVQTPYTFIMDVPKLSGSREEKCPDIGSVVAATPVPQNQSGIDTTVATPAGQDGPFRPHYQVDIGDGIFDKGTFSDGMAEYSQDWLWANGHGNIQRIRQEEFPSGCDISRYNTNLVWIAGNNGMQFTVNDQVVGTYKAADDSHGYIFEYPINFGDKLCAVNYRPATGYAILLGPNIYYHYDSYCYRGNCK
ncbi:MAG: hypothetical protein HND45_10755 [Chloroflexi bacterium]|nr:hypothetical protein [Chloroflexota bacterium]